MDVELLFSGYYCGPRTWLETYTFLRLFPSGRWVFASVKEPAFDFVGFVAALDLEASFRQQPAGGWVRGAGPERLEYGWGRFTRGQDVPAYNLDGQDLGHRLADALDLTFWTEIRGEYRFAQVLVVGPGRLRPSTHDVVLSFVPDGLGEAIYIPPWRALDEYYHRESEPFVRDGVTQFMEVIDDRQTVRRCRWSSREVIEEIVIPLTNAGCHIYAFNVSASGEWVATERISGQGEWGYDIVRTDPLKRVGGVDQARGYISEAPRFAADESRLAVFASKLLNWPWAEPSRGGYVNVGWLYFHRLPGLEETDHEVIVHLPDGWESEIELHLWRLPKEVTPVGDGVRMIPSGGLAVEIPGPLPEVIVLPTPHPSGNGFL